MGGPKYCGAEEINNNEGPAEATGRWYGAVEILVTERVQGPAGTWTIGFSVRGDASGRTYRADWGNAAQMWAPCPSTLPSNATPGDPGVPPADGVSGKLYLSKEFLDENGIAAEPKWPPLLPVLPPVSEELEVYPLKLELTGLEMRSGKFRKATIDLLDTKLAASRQTIVLDSSSPVRVHLTKTAFLSRFRLPFGPSSRAIEEALGVLKSREAKSQEIAGALGVIAAAAASAASAEEPDAKPSRVVRELLEPVIGAFASD